ncbi:OmpA family protein [Colwellia sp. D2M02]|uniref:flagellar motor protein MotB n=1 Tax=Colwellia sp. D2M02 TaxID=2841562 RepID=UPI001C093DE4|nr:flagellar motor protein MotB [Colwellia sp. D2M02]MBU2893216.1 OmpA family protein [Colwellia sp. D2M02]
MNRVRRKRHEVEPDNVHRWLVSYADYMTLLFALFVVLYAMAMVNEKPFDIITESFGGLFKPTDLHSINSGSSNDILLVKANESKKNLYGDGLLEVAGPELFDNKQQLSNISDEKIGSHLTSLEEELNTALYDIIESGYANLQIDGDWLEIELNSALLFPSGSSSSTNAAKDLLNVVYNVINQSSNFIRIRGYTDNQAINTEIFPSNWELSVYRATAILRLLEQFGIAPNRMAIEGYGQYYPTASNNTAEGRAENRKVVIAISKFGVDKAKQPVLSSVALETLSNKDNSQSTSVPDGKVKTLQLSNGGIRVTTRTDSEVQKESSVDNNNN